MNKITYRQISKDELSIYSKVSMLVNVTEIYEVHKNGSGIKGIEYKFQRKAVSPYTIDFMEGKTFVDWYDKFNLKNWAFFMAFEGNRPIGGAAVASKTEEIRMLEGREDITVLWDLRVDEEYKHCGIGVKLFEMGVAWSRSQGFKLMKIECQNTNLPACNFYQKQGAQLCVVNEHAYTNSEEIMLLWYLEL